MTSVEIGRGRSGRRAYGLDDVAIIPSRRTRDADEVSVAWQMDAYAFDVPVVTAPSDSAVSPATAREVARLGGLAVLDLEGLWTRHDDPAPLLAEVASLPPDAGDRVVERLRELYRSPVRDELVVSRLEEMADGGGVVAGALSPQRVRRHISAVLAAGADLVVIRGSIVSAEHVSSSEEPLNLKRFIADLDVPVVVGGCSTYQAALHLMRTGAAGVLTGVGTGRTSTTRHVLGVGMPQATTVADVVAARREYLDETGGRYVHVIADGGMRTSADIAKTLALGADAVMLGAPLSRASEAPGRGWHWSGQAVHPVLPRGQALPVGTAGTLEEVLLGPATGADGTTGLVAGLRRAMAGTGYSDLKEFQKVELAVTG